MVVAIDGFGGAGKSTLAGRLSEELGATVVHTDDFAEWANPLGWWPRLIEEVLRPLSTNEPARYQRFDWDLGELAEWHDVAPGGVVVIEGVSSSRAVFRPHLSLSVWVETSRRVRFARGIARDGDGMADAWVKWMADEDEWAAVERPREFADLVVSGTA